MDQRAQLWKSVFAESDDPILRQLMATAKLVHLPARQTVFYPGAECLNYLLVLHGTVRAQILTRSGRELMLYQVCAGQSCILTTSCLLGGTTYPAEGITETEVSAFAISAEDFFHAMEGSPYFRRFVFHDFSNRLANVMAKIEELANELIDHRLARLLLSEKSDSIDKTHQELAVELGTAREVISRHLKRFEQLGWVRLGRGTLELTDRPALRSLVES